VTSLSGTKTCQRRKYFNINQQVCSFCLDTYATAEMINILLPHLDTMIMIMTPRGDDDYPINVRKTITSMGHFLETGIYN